MEQFAIKKAVFVKSAAHKGEFPQERGMEIAVVGRSNVGKSSLLNSLCNNFKLARVSQSPGKTRNINYYLINDAFYLVDLPGYGFAKISKQEKLRWAKLLEEYLESGRVKHIFLLLDIRHEPTAEDKQMFNWILYYGVPFTLVATKADKIAVSKRQNAANIVAKSLGAPPFALPFSSQTRVGRDELIKRLGEIIADTAQNCTKDIDSE
ncbi:MAG TPA: YihA family ribosome biogenesis GTP-binding protein [Clostridiales bacterium]|nr:YihA family ribosome biogenesis GTP-binding protein [Clostridiales bacterium]